MAEQRASSEQIVAHTMANEVSCDLPGWLFVLSWEIHHPGGVNQVVENLYARARSHLHCRPLVMVRRWEHGKATKRLEAGRITVRASVREPWSAERPLRSFLSYLAQLPRTLRNLQRLIDDEGVVVVNVHYPELSALVWLLIRWLSRRPLALVLSFHGLDLHKAMTTRGMAHSSWRRLLQKADRLLVCAESMRLDLLAAFPEVEPQRVTVVDNGVDAHAIEAAAAVAPKQALPNAYLMSIGTYEHKKGHDLTIRAFDAIARDTPDLWLVLVGRYNAVEYARLDALRARLTSGPRILLLRDVEHQEAMRILSRARALVLASRCEPFGIVVLEAGALGLPVVATETCGVVRRLISGRDLLVVPTEDVDALAGAMHSVLSDSALAAELGRNLRERVRTAFDWDTVVHQYRRLPLFASTGGEAKATK